MKRISRFCVVLLLLSVGLALTFLYLSPKRTSNDLDFTHRDGYIFLTSGRKLKDNGRNFNGKSRSKGGGVNLDDYHLVDPAPAKASINHRPVEHGTPVIPYIPKPSPPPARPRYGGST